MALAGNHGIIVPRDKKLLTYLYWEQEMGTPQMAQLFGVNHKSILWNLKKLGIPSRPKGTSRHVKKCIETGCRKPVHKLYHRKNGSRYGRRCKEHWKAHRKKLPCHDINRPEVRARRQRQHTRWYYLGPLTIEGEKQWTEHARRLLRAAKRIAVDPTRTPEVCQFQKLVSKQALISQT